MYWFGGFIFVVGVVKQFAIQNGNFYIYFSTNKSLKFKNNVKKTIILHFIIRAFFDCP